MIVIALLALAAGGALAQGVVLRAPGPSSYAGRSRHASLPRAERSRLLAAYGRLALSYETNHGQFDKRVAFTAHAAGSTLALTADGALLTVPRTAGPGHDGAACARSLPRGLPGAHGARMLRAPWCHVSYSLLGMTLLGARHGLWPIGIDRQPGKVNYLIGKNRSRWHTDVSTYSRALYDQAWPGVDVGFSSAQRQIEYAFTLKPGADPTRIAIRVTGARSLRIVGNGDLVADLPGEVVVRERAPHAYQRSNNGRRVAVWSRYVLGADRVLRIAVGRYDRSRKLVIDPTVTLAYSTYLGGSSVKPVYGTIGDGGTGIAVDPSGAAYITGTTSSTDFPTRNALQPKNNNAANATVNIPTSTAFVTKLDPSGALVYSTYLGGSRSDAGAAIAVDATGAAYITGTTFSTDFPTKNAFQPTNRSNDDAFVTKLDPSGAGIAYSTYLGGSGGDSGAGIAVDPSGAAYITGTTFSTDFPTKNAFQPKTNATPDSRTAFVTKLDPTGALAYSTYLGGSGDDDGYGIAVDPSGAAYITGTTFSTDFPTKNAFQPTNRSNDDAFVTKLDPSGALAYSTYLGGSSGENSGAGIAVDSTGAAYVTGVTGSTDFPTKNAFEPKLRGNVAAFVTKLDPSGAKLAYSTYLGGGDSAAGIAVDSTRAAYVTGSASTNFPIKHAFQPKLRGGGYPAFVTKLDPSGATLAYSTYLGGGGSNGSDGGYGIAVDPSGGAYITGETFSTDFPTKNAFQPTNNAAANDNSNAFVSKLAPFTVPPQHTLTVSKTGTGTGTVTTSPVGIACGATCSASFDAGSMVTLSASANAGSAFAGFSGGGCSGTRPCSVTLSAGTTITATFTRCRSRARCRILHLRSLKVHAARPGCHTESSHQVHAAALGEPDCTLAIIVLRGTIDRRADGAMITVQFTPITRASVPKEVVARTRIRNGRWHASLTLPGRAGPEDRWRFTITFPGNKLLRPTRLDGALRLEVELG